MTKKKIPFFTALICLVFSTLFFVSCSCTSQPSNYKQPPLRLDDTSLSGPRAYSYDRTIQLENPVLEDCDAVKHLQALGTVVHVDSVNELIVTTGGWASNQVYNVNNIHTQEKLFGLSTGLTSYVFGGSRFAEIRWPNNGIRTIHLRDLTDGSTIATTSLPDVSMTFLAVVNDILVYRITEWVNGYASYNIFHNVVTGEETRVEGYFGTVVLSDPELNLLYLENSENTYITGTSTLTIIDVNNCEILNSITVPSQNHTGVPSRTDLSSVGKGIRFSEQIFDRQTGNVISSTPLVKKYTSLIGFTATDTLYSTSHYDIINGYSETQNEFAVYDNTLNRYIFKSGGAFSRAVCLEEDKFLLWGSGLQIAIVDINNIDGYLVENITESVRITKSPDNKATLFAFPEKYTDMIIDNGLMFFAVSNTVEVYNATNFEYVKNLTFSHLITSIDVHNGILAVGFTTTRYLGENLFFAYVKTQNWQINYVDSNKPSFSIAVFNGIIYFTGGHSFEEISTYNVKTQEIEQLPFSSYFAPYISINKKDGILIVGETGSSGSDLVFIKLSTNQVLFSEDHSYNNRRPIFCGEYVYFYGFVRDRYNGDRVFDFARIFPSNSQLEFLGLIYFDNTVSVSVAKNLDGQKVTVVFNTVTRETIEVLGDAEKVLKHNDTFYIVRSNRDTLYSVNF